MALCRSPSKAASERRLTTRPGLQTRYPLHLIKKWSWVVFVMVLGTFPLPSEGRNDDMELLKASVQSHGQSLRNMEHYLRKTNQFWNWYQSNQKRLNELLRDDPTPRTWDGQIPDILQLQIENMINSVQIQFEEEMKSLKAELRSERVARGRLEEQLSQNIDQQSTVTSTLQRQLQEQKETLQECQVSVRSLEENNCTCDKIISFVRNMAAQTNQSLDSMHEKFEGLLKTQTNPSKEQLAVLSAEVERQKISLQNALALQDSRKVEEVMRKVSEIEAETRKMDLKLNVFSRESTERLDWSLQNVSTKVDHLVMDFLFPLEGDVNKMRDNMTVLKESIDIGDQEIRILQNEVKRLSRKLDTLKSQSGRNSDDRIVELETQIGRLQGETANIGPLQERFETLSSQIQGTEGRLSIVKGEAADFKRNIERRVSNLEIRMKDPAERLQAGEPHRVSSNSLPAVSGAVDYSTSYSRINFPSGPDGRPGFTDSPGYTGFQGAPGSTGTDGFTGSRGEPGRPGNPGSRGAAGTPGSRGAPGSPGSRGAAGSPGSRGAAGSPGSRGAAGTPGSRGAAGSPGSRGAAGSPGSRGAAGIPGTPGNPGIRGTIGASGVPGLPGQPGTPGVPGPQGTSGEPGPQGTFGAPGEPGFRGSPGDYGVGGYPGFYGTSGLPGETGAIGASGAPGAPGAYRAPGPQGAYGTPGPRGTSGAPGERGTRGSAGDYGTRGRSGYYRNSDLTGDTGSGGLQGPPGLPGSNGARGIPGPRGSPGPAG